MSESQTDEFNVTGLECDWADPPWFRLKEGPIKSKYFFREMFFYGKSQNFYFQVISSQSSTWSRL